MVLIAAHRNGWDRFPAIQVHAAFEIGREGESLGQLIRRQNMTTQQQLKFQALLGCINGIGYGPGEGHLGWLKQRCGLPQLV